MPYPQRRESPVVRQRAEALAFRLHLERAFAFSQASSGDVLERNPASGIGAGVEWTAPTTPLLEESIELVIEGASASAAQTTLALAFGGGAALGSTEDLGVPVSSEMTAATVAVAWMSDNTPAGDWTLTLWRRTVGGSMSAVATFDLATS